MSETKGTIIELTEEQKKLMREVTGTDHQAIKVEVGTHFVPATMLEKRGLGKKGLGKKGLGKKGLGKKGLGKKGLGKKGLGKKGLGKKGLGKKGL